MHMVIVAPQRWLDPNHREFRPGLSEYEHGGKYLSEDGIDLTMVSTSTAMIDVSGETPRFWISETNAVPPKSSRKAGRVVRTNLFKKSAGWKWVEKLIDADPNFLISVETGGKHFYTLAADFQGGLTLARYPDAKSEPRLRPTTVGVIAPEDRIGTILVRGREHPVYRRIVVARGE